jgi:uncharacterized membrane protein YphA (DoxX/SURF4 family)
MTALTLTNPASHKPLRIALWIAQAMLAAVFGMAGCTKIATPIAQLWATMSWAASVPEALVRFIGTAELLGAIGLVLPAATRIAPRLTPLAATGLLVVMVLASMLHISRGEWDMLPITGALGAIAAFVAWGRSQAAPIAPRI